MAPLEQYNIENITVDKILDRFYNTYQTRRKIGPNPNGNPKPLIHQLHKIEVYKQKCIYSCEKKNEIKTHLVVKINNYPREKEYYILSVLWDDYRDLLNLKE
jgi:hypothetical protein